MLVRRLLPLCIIVPASAASAETCCIDPDIAAAFQHRSSYSRAWPESFPFSVSDPRFEFIAASSRSDGMQDSVAWKSEMSPTDARDFFVGEFEEAGWRKIPTDEDLQRIYQRGFVSSKKPPVGQYQQYCRDRDGQLSVFARSSDIGTVATVSFHNNRSPLSCNAMIEAQRGNSPWRQGMTGYLPVLELPDSIEIPPLGGSGVGGSYADAHASLALETDVPPEKLMAAFSEQMSNQAWRLDTGFQGGSTTGTVWLSEVDGLELVCLLTVVSGSEGKLLLRMHLQPI